MVCIRCPFHPGRCCGGKSSAFFNITAFNDFRLFFNYNRYEILDYLFAACENLREDNPLPGLVLNMQTVERSGATLLGIILVSLEKFSNKN